MRHSLLSAVMAALSKPAVIASGAAEHWRDGLARVTKSAWLLTHPSTCLELARLFASPKMRPILRIEPRLMFKFLRDYLAADLTHRERAGMLIHHYRFLEERASGDFFSRIVDRRLELWQLAAEGHAHRMSLLFPRTPHSEGDLTLMFDRDGVDLYNLSFTIGPGAIAGLEARDALYIARVQGKGHGIDQIRDATRSCGDVSPAALLLAAAEGIARALDLDHMIGVGADAHIILRETGRSPENLVKAYDEFWRSAGGTKIARNMYRLDVPSSGKPILAVKRDHRSRTHRKRKFKKTVKEQACRSFRAILGSATSEPGAVYTGIAAT